MSTSTSSYTPKSFIIPNMMTCTNCVLSRTRMRVVPGFGTVPCKVMGIGQSPGVDEDLKGKPFIGRAGKLLWDALQEIGWTEHDIFLHNINACHPPQDRKTTPSEKKACRGWLEQTITAVDPEVIICFGDEAAKAIIPNEKVAITKIRGTFYTVMLCGKPRIVMPTIHPSYVARNKTVLYPQLMRDLNRAKARSVTSTDPTSPVVLTSVPFGRNLATWEDIYEVIQKPVFAVDFETTSLARDAQIIGIGVADRPGGGMYWPILDQQDLLTHLPELKAALEDPNRVKIIFNAKFETHIAYNYGIEINPASSEDTMLKAWITGDNQSLSLKDLSSIRLDQEMIRIEELIGKGKKQRSMADVQKEDVQKVVSYAAPDPDATLQLDTQLTTILTERSLQSLYRDVEIPMMSIITEMERIGMKLDPSKLDPAVATLRESMWNLAESLWEMVGREFNPNSADQTADILYDELRIIPRPTRLKEGAKHPPTDSVSLSIYIDNPIVKGILSYRGQQKLLSYTEGLPRFINKKTGRIHTHINQTGAATGRVSSSDPNLQNIPARQRQDIDLPMAGGDIRKAFVAENGCYIYAPDLSQIEMRLQAHLAQDRNLMQVFIDGKDIHSNTVKILFNEEEDEITDPVRRKSCRFIAKCFHPDTEVLTRLGWRKITEIDTSWDVIQAVPLNSHGRVRLEWVKPTEVFTTRHPSNQLVHLQNMGIDIKVTPDHRMLGFDKDWIPQVVTPSSFPKVRYWANAGILNDTSDSIVDVDEAILQLAVATEADGSYSGKKIRFGFYNQRKIDRLMDLIDRLECRDQVNITSYKNGSLRPVTAISIKAPLATQIRRLLTPTKSFPWWWLQLSTKLRRVVLAEVPEWDGSNQHTSKSTQRWTQSKYTSGNQQSRDVIQAIASLTGKKAQLKSKPTPYLAIKDHNYSRGGHIRSQTETYTDEVACLSVPSSFVLVRSGGIPVITGQTTNFGIIYRLTPHGLLLRVPFLDLTIADTTKIINDIYNGYPGIKEYQDKQIWFCRKYGYVQTLLGRRRYIPDIHADKPEIRSAAERAAINMPIQGGAGDIFKLGMIACRRRLEELRERGIKSRMIMQVHDELLFEGPFKEKDVIQHEMVPLMAGAYELSVPLKADFEYGFSWGDLLS